MARFVESECRTRAHGEFDFTSIYSSPMTLGAVNPFAEGTPHVWALHVAESFSAAAQQMQENFKLRFREVELERVVSDLQQRVQRLEANQTFVAPIQTFDPEPYDLVADLFVVVQPDEDEFTATHFDSNLNAGGDNPVEAVENLKSVMLDTFEHYSALDKEGKLGVGPKRQLAVLQRFITQRKE